MLDNCSSIEFSYTDYGTFYGAYIYNKMSRVLKIGSLDLINKFLQEEGITIKVPHSFNPETLQEVCNQIKSKNSSIKTNFHDFMDVS